MRLVLQMPRMSGAEAVLAMRDSGFSNPVFGVTGFISDANKRVFEGNGCAAVFSKPLDIAALESHFASISQHDK